MGLNAYKSTDFATDLSDTCEAKLFLNIPIKTSKVNDLKLKSIPCLYNIRPQRMTWWSEIH